MQLPAITLDIPLGHEIDRFETFGGWCLDAHGDCATEVIAFIDEKPCSSLLSYFRADVSEQRAQHGGASTAGFVGDVVVPSQIAAGENVSVRVVARFRDGSTQAVERIFKVWDTSPPERPRDRAYHLGALLKADVPPSQRVAGVPHFGAPDNVPMIQLSRPGQTNRFGPLSLKLIEAARGGLFLDFGCGTKDDADLFAHGVYLDAVHFPTVDIVNTRADLPFKDNVFDLVISQAVFEHLPDPRGMAQELRRTLKPGGVIMIDTAFMQPQHGDPSHYFNMTKSGLLEVMQGFDILECGSQPYQSAAHSWMMQIGNVLPTMQSGPWRDRLSALVDEVQNDIGGFNEALGRFGREALAAGVYVLAKKPEP